MLPIGVRTEGYSEYIDLGDVSRFEWVLLVESGACMHAVLIT